MVSGCKGLKLSCVDWIGLIHTTTLDCGACGVANRKEARPCMEKGLRVGFKSDLEKI